VLSLPVAASAQAGGPGFLFRRPTFSFGIKGGYALAQGGSEIFDFAREELTLDKADFASSAWGAEMAVRATERLDIAAEVGVTHTSQRSEFRDWVDLDDLPIEQITKFTRVPMTLSARWYLRDRGRSVSRFVWVPERWSPYVGAGGGAIWYRFEQEGDFVDFETLDVFSALLESDGTTGTAHVFSGVDLSLSSKVVLTTEGRYSWGKMEMGRDFVDFDSIDLDGFQATVGLSLRF
jgi:outer membrane protein W